jgi:TatD DNase family protein
MFIDTHTHIYLDHFKHDLAEVIERARSNGVLKLLLPNIDSESIDSMFKVCEAYPETCSMMMGLHPTSVSETWQADLDVVEKWLDEKDFIAVGEIGIDLYWDTTFRQEQMEAFARQIQLARDHDLPFVIHSRNSFDEVFEVLDRMKNGTYQGIFHAFSGNEEQAIRAITLGFKLGIGGVVTYKNGGLDKTIEKIGMEHLVLETDAPYLTPVPFRGKRNEPSYVRYIAEKIALLLKQDVKLVEEITSRNAVEVFGIN